MMRAPVLAALMLCAPFAPAAAEAPEPYQLIRALQSLQDDAAAGRFEAKAAQPKLVTQIASAFRQADPHLFEERRNAEAAILFLFSGGPAGAVRPVASSLARLDKALLKGALAFAEGREEEARRQLLGIDALTQPGSIGGPLALVQAALAMHDDPNRAADLLDQARLLSPGTQIEEAALRRQVFIADEQRKTDRFIKAAALYRRRFPASIYGGSVNARLLPAVERFVPLHPEAAESLIGLLDEERRLSARLALARAALIEGRFALARALAETAARQTATGSVEAQRAALYGAASRAVSSAGGVALRSVDRAALPAGDALLLDAALSVADAAGANSPSAVAGEGEATSLAPDTAERALAALADGDALAGTP